ncbi:glutaredoxin family protein [Aquaspirillum serpens]|uniref:glutaredoxin family protein n=1 Tax=Aquaspirillum serpens TaxID=190 RepID=UPI0003B72AFE
MTQPITLTLYFREYCSLCHTMLAQLKQLQQSYPFLLDIRDVDADPELEARFDEKVPVLMYEEEELCHWHLDLTRVNAFLKEIR